MSGIPVARDATTAEFFDGTDRGRFLIRRCLPFGHFSRPQARQCSDCGSTDLRWEPASGRARLVSWAVVPGRPQPGNERGPAATIIAIGELEEGPWWWSKLIGAAPDTLSEGRPLRIAFERSGGEGEEAVPVFQLD
jgi:uncharacterized OB-fold protein